MKILTLFFLSCCCIGYSQSVTVDDSSFSPTDLVNQLLENACVDVQNVSSSSSQSVGYFNNTNSSFPISNGVVIRSGIAKYSEGNYTGTNLSSEVNSNSDADLEAIISSLGQSAPITDVAFLQFDFIPISSKFSFNFLFASNEYGEWQCSSSDVFAFLLTDLTTGDKQNLAVVPGTNIPITVREIRDNEYNTSCDSQHPELFGAYSTDASSPINMKGYTKVMNASATIIPGHTYRIRLAIGDSNDSNFDSAVFLQAGSFTTNINLGEDRTICDGTTDVIESGLDASEYDITWSLNGNVIAGETSPNLEVTQSGTYKITATRKSSNCTVSDEVVFSDVQVSQPSDLLVCNDGSSSYTFDLTQNNETKLGVNANKYKVVYYASTTDADNDNRITTPQGYQSSGNQTVYIKLYNTLNNSFCNALYSFQLLVNNPVQASDPGAIDICQIPGDQSVDLTQQNTAILNGKSSSDYTISYFNSAADALQNINIITNPSDVTIADGIATQTFWVRLSDNKLPSCFDIISFDVVVHDLPPVTTLADVIDCSSYMLPNIQNGDYYTGSNGTGTPLHAGDVVTSTRTIYIYSESTQYGCANQSSFKVTLVKDYNIGTQHCGRFVIPKPPTGGFYTAPDGPNGSGKLLPTGTVLTTSQTIYYYAEVNGAFCREKAYNIQIFPLPEVDNLDDVTTCFDYTLQSLNYGNYFTQPQGGGKQLNAGDVISSSQTIYIFSDDGRCTNETSFKVNIVPQYKDITACGSYTLPNLPVGNYYTQPDGQGNQIPFGTVVTASTTVYVYATTSTAPNCTSDLSFDITILPIPPVDSLTDVISCIDNPYVLPALTNGQYFTGSGRTGQQLAEGTAITKTQTIYINNKENICTNETSFHVDVRGLPKVENFTDVYSCDPFTLPDLTYGKYFTGPGATGNELHGGDVITTTQTIYIFNQWDDIQSCYNESFFKVNIQGVEEVGFIDDVTICDYYVLPPLTSGNYFSESKGKGTAYFAGDTITTSQTMYVYAKNGTRFICDDETSFNITISYTPILPSFNDVEKCGTYTLIAMAPANDDEDIGYYLSPGGEDEISKDDYTFQPGNYRIYVYASSKENPNCNAEESFLLTVYPLRTMTIADAMLCANPQTGEPLGSVTLYSGVTSSDFTVNWYLNGSLVHTGENFTTDQDGVYTVSTEKNTPEAGSDCNYEDTEVTVSKSSIADAELEVSEPFANEPMITVHVKGGLGAYQFQLDDGDFQDSNEFYHVTSGLHHITIKDIYGNCGNVVLEAQIINYPKFFTPNNDGTHDTWNIPDLANHPEALITIFNRHGKLLTKIAPNGPGWDGTYHGTKVQSDDYWFVVYYATEGTPQIFRSHFTLKR
ncbi:choice-of-anchor L domain-containing protein [Zhouia sp. PK063]|uniref:choice-of-anchor L domain-containing protein n=1 Tax=Zhouia sp. PK063 TaxID=3373602 RepID=UPI0037A88CB8